MNNSRSEFNVFHSLKHPRSNSLRRIPQPPYYVTTLSPHSRAWLTHKRRWNRINFLANVTLLSRSCTLKLLFPPPNCTGKARVYDDDDYSLVAEFVFAGEGEVSLINDVYVTETAAYFTDSFQNKLFQVRKTRTTIHKGNTSSGWNGFWLSGFLTQKSWDFHHCVLQYVSLE